MSTTATDAISALASTLVETAVAHLRTTLGPAVEVGDATVGDSLGTDALTGAQLTRHEFEGIPGAIVAVAHSSGDDDTDAAVADALVAGSLAAVAAATGAAGQLAASTPTDPSNIEASPTAVISCGLTTIAGSPIEVAWVVETALGNALQRGAPVAPQAASPSAAPTLPDLSNSRSQGASPRPGIDVLADVPMDVTVELGRTVMHVRDLLALGPGSVVELDRLAGSPVDVLVNGTAVATGNVVVVDNELAVRIIDIVER